MAFFGFITEDNILVNEYIDITLKRLSSPNLVTNPFTYRYYQEGTFRLFLLKPIWPKVHIIGLVYTFFAAYFNDFSLTFWLIPGILMVLSYVFFTKYFYYFVLKQGLKKFGYKGKIELLQDDDSIMRLLDEKIKCTNTDTSCPKKGTTV